MYRNKKITKFELVIDAVKDEEEEEEEGGGGGGAYSRISDFYFLMRLHESQLLLFHESVFGNF